MSLNYPAIQRLGLAVPLASDIVVDSSSFDNTLGAGDTDVQTALQTLDDITTHFGYGIIGPYNVLMQLYTPAADADVIGTKVNSFLAALREEGLLTVLNDITDLVVPVSPPDLIAPKINEIITELSTLNYLVGSFAVSALAIPTSTPDVLGAKLNEILKNMNTLNVIGAFESISHNDVSDNDVDNHLQYSRVDGYRAFTAPVGGVDPTSSTHLTTKNYVDNKAISTKIADYTLTSDDYFIDVDASSNTVEIKTPLAPQTGKPYDIYCYDSTFAVTVNFNGKNFGKSSADATLFEGENLSIVYNGTYWRPA